MEYSPVFCYTIRSVTVSNLGCNFSRWLIFNSSFIKVGHSLVYATR